MFLSLIMAVSFMAFGVAQAAQNQSSSQSQGSSQSSSQGQQVQPQNQEQNEEQNQEMNQGETQQVQSKNQEMNQEQNEEQNQKGEINNQNRQGTVSNFVQSLLQVADREKGGIGEQVRTVAQEQLRSEATTTSLVAKVQNRNKIQTFLFGSDYKNLGALRSEIVQTRNRIEQLNRLVVQEGNTSSTAEIMNQVQTLEQEQKNLESFIKAQESKFSLFGWLVKLFNK